ncbi:hypothetical protein [Halorussus sp. AFM4]|uniref:hypothetical protein n=1 Tax=Halorussus sp. AFM4 TaxID=3421651 RepID=UPI003EC09C4E
MGERRAPEPEELEADDSTTGAGRTLAGLHEWVFLTGNRWVIAGGLLVGLLAVLAAIEYRVGSSTQQLVPLFYMSSAIIGGNFTLITIVISISQLVISRQLSAPGELRAQIENTTSYREASLELVERDVPPATPAAFLEVLLRGVEDAVEALNGHTSEIASDDAVDAIDDVLSPLEDQIERSIRQIERQDTSILEALVVTLNTNYSEDIHQIWRLETTYHDHITPDAKDSLETLVTRLKQIDVARQYLKTVYIQEELSRLSRDLLYVGVPVIFAGLALMVTFVSTSAPALTSRQLSVITPVFAAVGAAPLALLFAYVLRLSVVSERTAAITPFTTPTQESTPLAAVTDDADD